MKSPHFPFLAIAGFLVILNMIFVGWFSIPQSRWIRVLTAAIFLGMYLPKFSRQTLLLAGALVSFLIADIFTLSYQLDSSKDGYFLFHGIAFSAFFLFVTKGTIQEQWSRFQKNYIVIASILSFSILLFFGFTFSSEIQGIQHLIFFYFHGFALIACLITALSYYERKANSTSLLFLLGTLGLLLSDVTAFAAVYLNADSFYYFSRIFYVSGLAGMVKFAYSFKPSPKPQAETISPVFIEAKADTAYHDH